MSFSMRRVATSALIHQSGLPVARYWARQERTVGCDLQLPHRRALALLLDEMRPQTDNSHNIPAAGTQTVVPCGSQCEARELQDKDR